MVFKQLNVVVSILLVSLIAKAESDEIVSESMTVLTQEYVDLSCQSRSPSVLIYKSFYVLRDIDFPRDCDVLIPPDGRLIIGRQAVVRFHGQIVADSRQPIFVFAQSGRAQGFGRQSVSMAWFKSTSEEFHSYEDSRRRVVEFGLTTDQYKVYIQGGTFLAKKHNILNGEEMLNAESSTPQKLADREIQSESQDILNSSPISEELDSSEEVIAKRNLPWSKSVLTDSAPDLSSKSCHDFIL